MTNIEKVNEWRKIIKRSYFLKWFQRDWDRYRWNTDERIKNEKAVKLLKEIEIRVRKEIELYKKLDHEKKKKSIENEGNEGNMAINNSGLAKLF